MFHHRWSVPIVARLFRHGPQPFATLFANLSASRDTLTDTLRKLEEQGVIERDRRGGKTVYALTALGREVGDCCVRLVDLIGDTDVQPAALKKWPMLVAVALGRGANRYNAAKAALPGITARALALALKDLLAIDFVTRTVDAGYPPTPIYALSGRGWQFFPALDALCRAAEAAVRGVPAPSGASS